MICLLTRSSSCYSTSAGSGVEPPTWDSQRRRLITRPQAFPSIILFTKTRFQATRYPPIMQPIPHGSPVQSVPKTPFGTCTAPPPTPPSCALAQLRLKLQLTCQQPPPRSRPSAARTAPPGSSLLAQRLLPAARAHANVRAIWAGAMNQCYLVMLLPRPLVTMNQC